MSGSWESKLQQLGKEFVDGGPVSNNVFAEVSTSNLLENHDGNCIANQLFFSWWLDSSSSWWLDNSDDDDCKGDVSDDVRSDYDDDDGEEVEERWQNGEEKQQGDADLQLSKANVVGKAARKTTNESIGRALDVLRLNDCCASNVTFEFVSQQRRVYWEQMSSEPKRRDFLTIIIDNRLVGHYSDNGTASDVSYVLDGVKLCMDALLTVLSCSYGKFKAAKKALDDGLGAPCTVRQTVHKNALRCKPQARKALTKYYLQTAEKDKSWKHFQILEGMMSFLFALLNYQVHETTNFHKERVATPMNARHTHTHTHTHTHAYNQRLWYFTAFCLSKIFSYTRNAPRCSAAKTMSCRCGGG
jgi:hypothetical protein